MKLIKTNWDDKKIHNEVDKLISIHDDGELFIEEVYSENVLLDDNKIKSASYDNDKGFGLRAVHEDKIKFFHSSELDEESFKKALKSITYSGRNSETKNRYVKTNKRLYENLNPLSLVTLKSKIDFLRKVNDYARKLDNNVKQVSVSLNGNFQNIEIIKEGGNAFYDSRPLVRMNVTVSVEKREKSKQVLSVLVAGTFMKNFFKPTTGKTPLIVLSYKRMLNSKQKKFLLESRQLF